MSDSFFFGIVQGDLSGVPTEDISGPLHVVPYDISSEFLLKSQNELLEALRIPKGIPGACVKEFQKKARKRNKKKSFEIAGRPNGRISEGFLPDLQRVVLGISPGLSSMIYSRIVFWNSHRYFL